MLSSLLYRRQMTALVVMGCVLPDVDCATVCVVGAVGAAPLVPTIELHYTCTGMM